MTAVYVATNSELGWDCVVAVFGCDKVTESELLEEFGDMYYNIARQDVEEDLSEWGE